MKGIILAAGRGSRLLPLTLAVDKHLLPVYDEPMIFKVIKTLVKSGITDICLIISKEVSNNINILGSGKLLGCKLTYICQEEPNGIAEALYLAKDFAKREKVAVLLGDNIFEDTFEDQVNEFDNKGIGCGASIFLKSVSTNAAKTLGVAEIEGYKVTNIVEKPQNPPSLWAVTGLYFFDEYVFDWIDYQRNHIGYSERGELEITDLNKLYLEYKMLDYYIVNGFWIDAGTFDNLTLASSILRARKKESNNKT